MLHARGIGAIVIKKHLVGPVDERITDLGVYPLRFVKQIETDPRFTKVFSNDAVSIYSLPAEAKHHGLGSSFGKTDK